jgi:hypothetical protein
MITLDDCGEIHCTYTTCSREFCEGEICHAGLYQCPHNKERAKACLSDAIDELEDFKSRNKKYEHDDEYYEDLAHLEARVNEYKRFLK